MPLRLDNSTEGAFFWKERLYLSMKSFINLLLPCIPELNLYNKFGLDSKYE